MMKKNVNGKAVAAMALAVSMMFSLTACGSSDQKAEPDTAAASSAATESVAEAENADATETAAAGTDSETPSLDEIKERGKLIVGTSADYPPYEFHTQIDGEDTIVGFDMSIAKFFAEGLGVELEIVDMPFDSLLIGLQEGDFDLVMAGMTATDERKKSADFTDIIFANDQVVLINAKDEGQITDTESLKGKTVGAQTGSLMYDLAVATVGAENVIGLTKTADLIMELKAGNIDAMVTNTISGTPYAVANDDLLLVDVGFEDETRGFSGAVQKGHEDLIAYLNEQIVELNKQKLIEQYVIEAQELAGVEE